MIPITIVTEDRLSEGMVRLLLNCSSRPYEVIASYPNLDRKTATGGNTYIEQRIESFNQAAIHGPYLILLDLDLRVCAPTYIESLLPGGVSRLMMLRVAVREVESWVLADREMIGSFLDISTSRIPRNPDELSDPKRELLALVGRSRRRSIRSALLPQGSTASQGPDYNGTMMRAIEDHWKPARAVKRSPSLARAVAAIEAFEYRSSATRS